MIILNPVKFERSQTFYFIHQSLKKIPTNEPKENSMRVAIDECSKCC